jgi:hypothetical protein
MGNGNLGKVRCPNLSLASSGVETKNRAAECPATTYTINGVGLLAGGWASLKEAQPTRMNSMGVEGSEVPFSTLFTGALKLVDRRSEMVELPARRDRGLPAARDRGAGLRRFHRPKPFADPGLTIFVSNMKVSPSNMAISFLLSTAYWAGSRSPSQRFPMRTRRSLVTW